MESDDLTCLEIKTSADGRPLEFVVKASAPVLSVDLSHLSQALQEARKKLQDFIPIDLQAYYAEQQRIANDLRWQNDPLEISHHLEIIWDDILCNASDLFHLLGDICNDLGDRFYPYN